MLENPLLLPLLLDSGYGPAVVFGPATCNSANMVVLIISNNIIQFNRRRGTLFGETCKSIPQSKGTLMMMMTCELALMYFTIRREVIMGGLMNEWYYASPLLLLCWGRMEGVLQLIN